MTDEQTAPGATRIPILVLSGFLGSGKTTLLQRLLKELKGRGLKPAVLMNEIGEYSLDGALIPNDVPMKELMDGCICCSVRGELSLSVKLLVEEHAPDMILVEATGVANPVEIVEALTDTSLVVHTELRSVITVAGADAFLAMVNEAAQGISPETLALMEDQVRTADTLVLNRTDLVKPVELEQIKRQLVGWNRTARFYCTQHSRVDAAELGG